MDVNAIRLAIAAKCAAAGYNSKEFVPEDVADFPAAVVGNPESIDYRLTMGLALISLKLTVAASAADMKEAQRKLDAAVSTEGEGSIYAALEESEDDSWRNCHVTSIDPVRLISAGSSQVLARDFALDVTAPR